MRCLRSYWQQARQQIELQVMEFGCSSLQGNQVDGLQALSRLFDGYDIYISRSQTRVGRCIVVLLRKELILEMKTIFMDTKCKLIVFGVIYNDVSAFRMVAIYATNESGKFNNFIHLESTKGRLIRQSYLENVPSLKRKEDNCFSNLLSRFQWSGEFRMDDKDDHIYTCTKSSGSLNILLRVGYDKSRFRGPQFQIVNYTEHRFLICKLHLDFLIHSVNRNPTTYQRESFATRYQVIAPPHLHTHTYIYRES